jgi:uncharacterized SAM-binding protein YcdF (DUF218 family)
MADLLRYLFSVDGSVVLCLAGVAWLFARPRSAQPRRWLAAVVVFYALASVRAVPWVLGRPLVYGLHQFSIADAPGDSTAIVLLGAGTLTVHGRENRMGLLYVPSAARALEAVRVYQILASPWVISSGGEAEEPDAEPNAVTMRDALMRLGVPAGRILLESSSVNTHDEAVLVAPMLRALRVERVVLVTSDIHMRRSLATFRAAGVDAVPAIASEPQPYRARIDWMIPTSDGLELTGAVVHEYAGLLYYGARGWLRF